MEFILQSLGWRFAAEGKKAEPHMPCFKVLGVLLDMTESSKGKVVVSNKPERINDLVQIMVDILDKGYLTGSEAASLHGQLNFTQGQCYGCVLKHGVSSKDSSKRMAFRVSTGACYSRCLHCFGFEELSPENYQSH